MEKREQHANSFNEIINYYNHHSKAFKEFENVHGINLWFLNHFRTYFNYRNAQYTVANNQTELPKNVTVKRQKTIGKLWNLIQEIILMIWHYRRPKTSKNNYLLISNTSDLLNGKNKRFGTLETSCDVLLNRKILTPYKHHKKNTLSVTPSVYSDALFVKVLFSISTLRAVLKFRKDLKALKLTISKEPDDFKGNYKRIHKLFWKDQLSFFIYYVRYRAFYNYFKKYNYKAVLLSDENSPQQKVIQYAAKQFNIVTCGFQHGNIHLLHPAYVYHKYDLPPLLPDLTFTWGEYFTKLLTTIGGYPIKKVRTVGRILPSNQKKYVNPVMETDKQIILYASQPHREENLCIQFLEDIIHAIKPFNDRYQLIVRPHPRELDDEFFYKIGRDIGYSDFYVDRYTDLDTQMAMSTSLIVAFSTVGTEFVPQFKPIYVLDYSKEDLMGWIDRGVGIPVYNKAMLKEHLEHAQIIEDKTKNEAYVKDYFYVSSGAQESQIIDIIDEHV